MDYRLGSAVIEGLTSIWQRVLQRSSLDIEDNFFDLGGNVQLADLLFAEIAQRFGRELPSATICQAPTIASLASLLERPVLPRFSPLVQIKAGREKPPVLMVHGLAGYLEFIELARHIRTEHPIYGIQAKGTDGMEEPLERVEDMAQYYLDALKELQPRGPYVLFGYSVGGLVALEMAQRLSASGEKIALLVLMDAYPHPRYLSPRQLFRLIAQRTKRRISKIKQRPSRERISYLVHGIERRLRLFGVYGGSPLAPETSRLSFVQTGLRVTPKAYRALAHYSPRFYQGKIRFVRAEADYFFPRDPCSVWGKLAAELEVEIVPGDHNEIVTTHFDTLAPVLSRYLSHAFDEESV